MTAPHNRSDFYEELRGMMDSLDDSVSAADASYQLRKLADELDAGPAWTAEVGQLVYPRKAVSFSVPDGEVTSYQTTSSAEPEEVISITDEDQLTELLEAGDIWHAVRDATGDVYLLFATEDDYAYQGVPMESDQGGDVDHNSGSLTRFPGHYPLAVLPQVS